MVRTYKEAVEIMVNWWIEKSFHTLFNQNNGDNSPQGGLGFALMNSLSMQANDKVTPEKIEKFKSKSTKLLLLQEGKGRFANQLDVDYNVHGMLAEVCKFSDISEFCIPIKTFTYIDDDNTINGRYQYGGEWFKI